MLLVLASIRNSLLPNSRPLFHLLLFPLILFLFTACRGAVAPAETDTEADRPHQSQTAAQASPECQIPATEQGNDQASQAALGEAYKTCFEQSKNAKHARLATEAYIRAAQLAQQEGGRLSHTREISDLLVRIGDKKRLQEVFAPWIQATDSDNAYLALVDYADGLARLGDESAWQHFEHAIEIHPQNNVEAINRYARHLIDRGHPKEAAEMLEKRLTREQRIRLVRPAYLWQEALRRAGLNTAPADEEVARLKGQGDEKDPGASGVKRTGGSRPT